eukprot:3502-Pelagococcus_subviridis.AAC.3
MRDRVDRTRRKRARRPNRELDGSRRTTLVRRASVAAPRSRRPPPRARSRRVPRAVRVVMAKSSRRAPSSAAAT